LGKKFPHFIFLKDINNISTLTALVAKKENVPHLDLRLLTRKIGHKIDK
jgi:hypothetical protein